MAGVNVKMGVSGVNEFKRGMKDSESAVKTLNEQLKLNESQLKETGDQETYLKNKTQILQQAIEKQTEVVRQAQAALKAMKDDGVTEASGAFQTMQRKVFEAQGKLSDMKAELKNVGSEAKTTGEQLDTIGKGVSWDNVAEGLGKMTDAMSAAAQKAMQLGRAVARSAMDSSAWADDILTRATQYEIDPETLQKMDRVAEYIDTDVDAIISAKDRLARNRDTIPELLGIVTDGKSVDDLFWETGNAIMGLGDGFDKAEIAQKIFGRSWREMLPLFKAGRDEYESLMDSQNVLTTEQVEKLGAADDSFKQIQQQWEQMKNEFWADNADKITELMQWLIDNADGVKAAMITIAAGFGALKIAEFAANLGKTIDGLKTLGLLKGAADAAGAAGGGGGFFGWLGGFGKKIASAGGGVGGFLAALGLAGWAGKEMIEANLNDASLNQVYGGNGGTGDIIDTMSDATAALAAEYFRQWQNAPGTEAAYDARDALKAAFEEAGVDMSEDAVGLLENVFKNFVNESDPDGLVKKLSLTHPEIFSDGGLQLPAQVDPDMTALQEQMNSAGITVPVTPVPDNGGGGGHGFANGLPFVPYDGFYRLHRGERVTPAREVNSRNFSSNLYVENMHMGGAVDAAGLADRMAAAQRRAMSAYGN